MKQFLILLLFFCFILFYGIVKAVTELWESTHIFCTNSKWCRKHWKWFLQKLPYNVEFMQELPCLSEHQNVLQKICNIMLINDLEVLLPSLKLQSSRNTICKKKKVWIQHYLWTTHSEHFVNIQFKIASRNFVVGIKSFVYGEGFKWHSVFRKEKSKA